jgi:hypothetical protein
MEMNTELVMQTTNEIIKELGGTTAVAKIVKRMPQHVVNWRASGKFPPWTFLILTRELSARGISAPASLWRIEDPNMVAPPIAPEEASQ